jgi:hypothetical protein
MSTWRSKILDWKFLPEYLLEKDLFDHGVLLQSDLDGVGTGFGCTQSVYIVALQDLELENISP